MKKTISIILVIFMLMSAVMLAACGQGKFDDGISEKETSGKETTKEETTDDTTVSDTDSFTTEEATAKEETTDDTTVSDTDSFTTEDATKEEATDDTTASDTESFTTEKDADSDSSNFETDTEKLEEDTTSAEEITTAAPDALVISIENLSGYFNPFYYKNNSDKTVIDMTQLYMLTDEYINGSIEAACGDDNAVVVKDYNVVYDNASNKTTYTFVIKNGIKFSDGKPLTMNDVLFNLYVYLDPVYTGSSTIYSTDIVGLDEYRTQNLYGQMDENAILEMARLRANDRIDELVTLFKEKKNASASKYVTYSEMKEAIAAHSLSNGYKMAISNDISSVSNSQLQADYDLALKYFKEELERDFESAKDSYKEEPYKSAPVEFDEIVSFMYAEGFVEIEYEKDVNGKDIKSKIKKVTQNYSSSVVVDKASAIEYVYTATINNDLDVVLKHWATAQTLFDEYTAQAKEVIIRESLADGKLTYNNISGIVSLGHTTDVANVKCKNRTYTVAKEHNADGTVKYDGEYDVLQITINGVDPKAIWNFAFAVAPQHYYAPGYEVDIANNKFGVEWGSFDFMKNVIQNPSVTKLPMGAGAYKATNLANDDNPNVDEFYDGSMVYFKENDNFLMGMPKIRKVRYKVVSSSNVIEALENGDVHFATSQFTKNDAERLNSITTQNINQIYINNLGYGYIGINAGLVPDINIRRAILTAMDTSLALNYYVPMTAQTIYWPMSAVSWAYPKTTDGKLDQNNGHYSVKFDESSVKAEIQRYMEAAGVYAGDRTLKIRFTIAGTNTTDSPIYLTFHKAAEILNSCGWQIDIVSDALAYEKIATGSLAVWAAEQEVDIDPDMYEMYHKNSTMSNIWGYSQMLTLKANYPEENAIINELSDIIDQARQTEDKWIRTALYKQAMSYVLDLAVELPVYQRGVLYAYNSNVIKSETLSAKITPYSSPLDRIWEIEFVK